MPQEVSWRDDIDTVVAADDEEVLVATHDQGCSRGDSRGQYHVVGISGHAHAERRRLDDSNAKSQLFQERQGGRTERELPAQGVLEFVEQGGRRHNGAATQRTHHDLVTQSSGDQRRDDHVRVEDDNHDTIANTSSSV